MASKKKKNAERTFFFNFFVCREFVVNIISEWFVEAANHCCGNFSYGTNEMTLSGLTPVPSEKVTPPRVAESAVQLECIVRHVYDASTSTGGSTVVIGEVVMWHVAQGVAGKSPSGKLVVDIQKLRPISRLGGNTYGRTNDIFDLPRPDR
jgi:flavin reductase (DIM6/NTAB) family NADH-FMN oxidoreductase RutF